MPIAALRVADLAREGSETVAHTLQRSAETGIHRLADPRTDDELLAWVETFLGLKLPRQACSPAHTAPAKAFCDAYFARFPVMIWKGSRGLAGKTTTMGALGVAEAVLKHVDVTILGGSGQQSVRVLEGMGKIFDYPQAPRNELLSDPGGYKTEFKRGNKIIALTASQRSARGPHPVLLICDEIDEMNVKILNAAQGQPLDQGGFKGHTVLGSTHQYPDGTMSAKLREAAEKGWPVYTWCWRCVHENNGGWLTQDQVDRKRADVTAQMWSTEFDLQEPSTEGRVFDTTKVAAMFDASLGRATALQLERGWVNEPPEWDPRLVRLRQGVYYGHGCDWANVNDYSVRATGRLDVRPIRVVAASMRRKQPWDAIIGDTKRSVDEFPGSLAHDRTSMGGQIIAQQLDPATLDEPRGSIKTRAGRVPLFNVEMVGQARKDLFSAYISAVERGEVRAPFIEPFESEHKFCTWKDLYGGGHPPDSVVAMAMMWYAFQHGRRPGDLGIS